jgi:Mg/Co/Ni transporter MgtE
MWQKLLERAGVLIALLIFQSCSSFILEDYEVFLLRHSVIVFFLTMLVGAGGNAGSQAAVLVVRGLATGEITARNAPGYVLGEAKMAFSISVLMVGAGYVRVILFGYSQLDALAISCSLLAIVFSSVLIGSTLPLMLHRWQLDPAHAGATIQVIMDLMGVCITCLVCSIMLKGEPHSISTPEEDRLVGEYEVLQQ